MASVVTAYAAAAVAALCRWVRSRLPARTPKVKRLCSSVASRVDATVTRALATAHGSQDATATTAPLETTPTPPPQSTKRAKAAKDPGRAGRWRAAVCVMTETIRPSMTLV
ncbi:hypothetical protein [Streptomyces sp. NPDC021622]|uniref:hypothetical protein n=1 Tax=Streptomyces sp. NPDC021622 TaxID=3155013 RepID=UPI0033EFCB68